MDTERIKEIQSKTAYPDSISVQQALFQVWNECGQEKSNSEIPGLVVNISSPMSRDLRELVDEWKKDHKDLFPEEGITFELTGGVIKDSSEKEKSVSEGQFVEFNPIDYSFEKELAAMDEAHKKLLVNFACQAFDIKYRSDDSFRAVAEELYDEIYNSDSKEV